MGRDQNHATRVEASLLYEPTREIEAALPAEIDVDEGDLRSQLLFALKRLSARGGDAHDANSLLLEEGPGGLEKGRAVVDDEAAQSRHALSIAAVMRARIEGSRNLVSVTRHLRTAAEAARIRSGPIGLNLRRLEPELAHEGLRVRVARAWPSHLAAPESRMSPLRVREDPVG
jgi:hypothetical protein